MLHFSKITDFSVELSPSSCGVYTTGELLSGQVVVELCKALKISALEVCARGLATVHWLETRSIGMNTVYSDFTAHETYLRKRHHLIRAPQEHHPWGAPHWEFLAPQAPYTQPSFSAEFSQKLDGSRILPRKPVVCTLLAEETDEELVEPNREHILYFLVSQWGNLARRDPLQLHKELDKQNDVFCPSSFSDMCTGPQSLARQIQVV